MSTKSRLLVYLSDKQAQLYRLACNVTSFTIAEAQTSLNLPQSKVHSLVSPLCYLGLLRKYKNADRERGGYNKYSVVSNPSTPRMLLGLERCKAVDIYTMINKRILKLDAELNALTDSED